MSDPDGRILVLGVGNVLLRDEGIGVHVVRALETLAVRGDIELTPRTSLLDGGTLGLRLLPLIWDARAVLLIDAVDLGRTPGTVEVIDGDTLRLGLSGHAQQHRAGVGGLLGAARMMGALPEAVALIGIQPGEITTGLELTEAVRVAVPVAVETALDELRRLDEIARPAPGAAVGTDELAGAVA